RRRRELSTQSPGSTSSACRLSTSGSTTVDQAERKRQGSRTKSLRICQAVAPTRVLHSHANHAGSPLPICAATSKTSTRGGALAEKESLDKLCMAYGVHTLKV